MLRKTPHVTNYSVVKTACLGITFCFLEFSCASEVCVCSVMNWTPAILFIYCFNGAIYDILTLFVFNRGGRKPFGFLSLICKKSSSDSAEDTKGSRGKIQKPQIATLKRNQKKNTPSSKEICSLPSTSTSSSVEYEDITADAVVTVCLLLNVLSFLRYEGQ